MRALDRDVSGPQKPRFNMQNRKQTAWKKSRRFGEIHGGRTRRRMTDNIFARCHSLTAPALGDALPLIIEDNPSRDFFFPLSGDEVRGALRAIPDGAADGLTHIWLRRMTGRASRLDSLPLAQFICGSGVRLIVLYPWRQDLRRYINTKFPKGSLARAYRAYAGSPILDEETCYFQFELNALRRFYLEHLLLHEVGHHVDWYNRHWSKANVRSTESAADAHAVEWAALDVFHGITQEAAC